VARHVVAAGMLISSVFGLAKPAQAQPLDGIAEDTIIAANEANVNVVDLLGATASTGLTGRQYLLSVGELETAQPPPAPVLNASVERRLDCIQAYESRGYASAVNRSSGASGLFQFLPSTWITTPQGKAGLSVFDPVAARNAARWMLEQGRAREWVPVLRGLC